VNTKLPNNCTILVNTYVSVVTRKYIHVVIYDMLQKNTRIKIQKIKYKYEIAKN